MSGEISYDLVMTDDMSFVEGCYRLAGGDWRVVVVSRGDTPAPEVTEQVWESGIGGLHVSFPKRESLNAAAVEQ